MDDGTPQDDGSPSADNTNMNSSESTASAQAAEVEVIEDKEGPNNQVVYKYQGGLYYVDREQEQLVKIEESQLEDAEHPAIIKNSMDENENDNNK
jgi:hypothetical protein